MPEPFRGLINVDIRDSEPDWTPFEPPEAPKDSPNVVYIVLDDVGFSAMSCYGGPIETPNIDRIAGNGVRYSQWHTTALCSPTRSCLLTGRNHTRNSMACITEAAIGFPNGSGTIPPENGMLSEILSERGWNTYWSVLQMTRLISARATLPRRTFSMISSRRLGPLVWLGIDIVMSDVILDRRDQIGDAGEAARRIALSVSSRNHRSTRFSQLELVGIKCRVNRGCSASQVWERLGAHESRSYRRSNAPSWSC